MAVLIHNIPAPGTYTASADPNTNDVFVIEKGIGTIVIDGFIGVGPGANPSAAIKAKMDVLKFMGEGIDAKNMILTVNGSDLVIQFEDPDNKNHVIPDTMVVLTNFSLYNLDNVPASGAHVDTNTPAIGNILFDGQNEGPGKMFQSSGMHDSSKSLFVDMTDNYDVANSAPMNSLFNKSTVSFLSESSDTINDPSKTSGNDVINGMGGNDTIYGGKGDDVIRGGKGNDKIFGQDGKDTLYGDEGKDTIYGGGNEDTIYGGTGNDVIYGDYGNKAPMQSPNPETKTVTQKVTGDADAWADAGFTLTAYKANGDEGVVTYGNAQQGMWLGVQGETTPGPLYDDEIGYDPTQERSEKLVVDFNKDVHKAVVDLTYFYGVKSGADGNVTIDKHKVNEVLHWEAYDDGVKVESGDIINNNTNSPNFSFTIELNDGKVFDTVEFSAKPYDNAKTGAIDNGQGSYKQDSSDYGIKAITICYEETVTPQPNPEMEAGAADVIFGNEGNDKIHGNEGDDVIHGDDWEHQASHDFHDAHLGSYAMDQNSSNYASNWLKPDVTITAIKEDGTTGSVAVPKEGIGVAGKTTGFDGPNDETGYNPTTGKSEALVINFGHLVLAATLGLSRFYSAAEGADQGKNEVMQLDFYREGEIVNRFFVASNGEVSDGNILSTVDTGNGLLEVHINNIEFDEIKISGLPYDDPSQPGIDDDGQGNITNDSSDASLMYVDYTYRTESNPAGFDDKIWGDDGNDHLYGDQGNDVIHGGKGDDFISGGTGDDKLFGDAGNDVMHGDDGQDKMHGGSGNDVMFGDGGHDTMYGDAGNDMMFGYTGKDKMYGGDGDDFIYGEQDDDYAEGGKGNDTFDMGTGNDKAYGQEGDDTYIHDMRLFVRDPVTNGPYVENPTLYDENMPAGTLKQFVDSGMDYFDGGPGMDTIDLRGTASPMTEGPSNWLIHIDTPNGGIDITATNFDDYQAFMNGNILDINALSGGMNKGYIETTLSGSDNASENGLARLDFVNVEKILIEDGQII